MRRAAALVAVTTLSLSGPATSGSAANVLPPGPWELTVCEGTASTGSTCAHLNQTLKLRVKYGVGPADIGRVLFEQTISHDLAQEIFARGLAVIRAFDQVPPGSADSDGEFFIVHLKANGHAASVEFLDLSGTDDFGPEVKGLAGILSQITHAF